MHGPFPTDLIIDAYKEGVFPMAESAADPRFAFYRPHLRGLIPIAGLHIPDRLLKTLRRGDYSVTANLSFDELVSACAAATPARAKTWINAPIREIFGRLHREGHAHSVECRDMDGRLTGGLYGLAIGAVFCGESMFSVKRDASKIALVHLCALLQARGFTILDSQFLNPHLVQFGAYEMPQEEYERIIAGEMEKEVPFNAPGAEAFRDILKSYLAGKKG